MTSRFNDILTSVWLRLAAALTAGSAVTGCFTGVESTPRITSADVKRQAAPAPAETDYLAGTVTEPMYGDWKPGKRLLVTDDKIALALEYPASESDRLAGTTLVYTGARAARDLGGNAVTELTFDAPSGRTYAYRLDIPADSLGRRKASMPFTIDLDVVEAVERRLTGNTYYITTSGWRNDAGDIVRQPKYIAVKVDSVMPGNTVYPVKVAFHDKSHPSRRGYEFLNPAAATPRSPGAFALYFALSDPRLRYPDISDKAWANITESRVAEGMTRDECRLALGAPDDIIRQPGYNLLHERWSYNNGKYLIFEDGILTRHN